MFACTSSSLRGSNTPAGLDEIGSTRPPFSQRDAAFLESIMAIGDIDEECRAERSSTRELLLQFGRMVPAMRAADVEFVQVMNDYENVSEECLEYLLEVRDFLVRMQNDDIRSCAEWSWRALKEDSLGRFFPYHNSFARDNLAAVSQVMETLGRNRLVQDPERVRVELEGELEYYENLNGGQVELLWKEIVAHADMADETYQYLDECREMTKLMQSFDHEYMMDLLENDCYE
ncbi:hypothetical protein quinque_012375 [Culex quinquefasciatus]